MVEAPVLVKVDILVDQLLLKDLDMVLVEVI